MEVLRKAALFTALSAGATLAAIGLDTLVTREMNNEVQACYSHPEGNVDERACAEAIQENYLTQGLAFSLLELAGVAGVAGGGFVTLMSLNDERRY